MPATRNILSHLRFEVAIGVRTCDVNSKHTILPGDRHVAYETAPAIRKNICMASAPSILDIAQKHLTSVLSELDS